MTNLKLAGLLCSRLCHDLAGPIGALQNGLELLAEDDDPDLQAQALDLVALASGQASRKLRFYRLVFGAGLGGGEDLAAEECREALTGLLAGGRVTVEWELPDGQWQRPDARLLLALALLAVQGLPRGGRLRVAREGRAGEGQDAPQRCAGVAVAAEGAGAALQEQVEAFATGRRPADDAATPLDAVACLAYELGRETGSAVAIERGADRFAFRL